MRSVHIPDGVEYIGRGCFQCSGVEEVALPGTLMEIGEKAFCSCGSLRVVFLEGRCQVDVRKYVSESVTLRHK